MKKLLIAPVFLLCWICSFSQQEESVGEEESLQMESLAEKGLDITENDGIWQERDYFRRHPLDLNLAGKDDLSALGLLSEWEISNFLQYRKLLGPLVSVYELQAVPGWTVELIKKIMPYVFLNPGRNNFISSSPNSSKGLHQIAASWGRTMQLREGYKRKDSGNAPTYLGSPGRYLVRYRYVRTNLFRISWLAEKDPGEPFFRLGNGHGFDFYSYHLEIKNKGILKTGVLGDYAVNLGQGLLLWQSLAFKKSGEVLSVKREGPAIRSYSSPGEFAFCRGAAITLQKGSWQSSLFVSRRKYAAYTSKDSLSGNQTYVTSLDASGYHRTPTEMQRRSALGVWMYGGNLSFSDRRLKLSLNLLSYSYSIPFRKRPEPYNYFQDSGKNQLFGSMDFSYTRKNLHFFGEFGGDRHINPALVAGMLASLDPKIDFSMVYRNIHAAFQTPGGNAFTESALLSNEKGLYVGFVLRPSAKWKLDIYADWYQFPWIRFNIHTPGFGQDFLVQLTHFLKKDSKIYFRYRTEHRIENDPDSEEPVRPVEMVNRQAVRIHTDYRLTKIVSGKTRAEWLVYEPLRLKNREEGFLIFQDLSISPSQRRYKLNFRIQYFETQGYSSRIYAYERDLPNSFNIPAFYDKGIRVYLLINFNINKLFGKFFFTGKSSSIFGALRLGNTYITDKETINNAMEMISGKNRTDIAAQIRVNW